MWEWAFYVAGPVLVQIARVYNLCFSQTFGNIIQKPWENGLSLEALKRQMVERNSASPNWLIIWHKHKVQKKAAFLCLVIHKAIAMNKRRERILAKIDKSCPHCGLPIVKSVEHIFFTCPLAQQVWHYVANIIWQLFAKRGNLGLRKSFSMMHCLSDQLLSIPLKPFNRTWWITWCQQNVVVFNALQWPMEKTHQVVWDSLLDYDKLEWQQTLIVLGKNTRCYLQGRSLNI